MVEKHQNRNVRLDFIYFFLNFCYNQQMHKYIMTVYITTVSLCHQHCCMFRHFVIIRQFTTNILLSNPPSWNCSYWN